MLIICLELKVICYSEDISVFTMISVEMSSVRVSELSPMMGRGLVSVGSASIALSV